MFYGIEYVPEDSTADSINNIYLNGVRIAALDQDSAVAYFITDQVDSVNLVLDDAGRCTHDNAVSYLTGKLLFTEGIRRFFS